MIQYSKWKDILWNVVLRETFGIAILMYCDVGECNDTVYGIFGILRVITANHSLDILGPITHMEWSY